MIEEDQRAAVVVEATRWVGTPYHHGARILGHGVDCGQLLIAVYGGLGLIPEVDAGQYTHDWHMHKNEEKYLSFVERYAFRVDDTEDTLEERLRANSALSYRPGDVLVWRLGRTFSHGAIVARWPNIIHSYFPSNMVEQVSVVGTPMARRPMRVYSYWRD